MHRIAVAWLQESDWPAWQELDDQLPDYARWCAETSNSIRDAEREGLKTEKYRSHQGRSSPGAIPMKSQSARTRARRTPPRL
jgi:hypothetical protein